MARSPRPFRRIAKFSCPSASPTGLQNSKIISQFQCKRNEEKETRNKKKKKTMENFRDSFKSNFYT